MDMTKPKRPEAVAAKDARDMLIYAVNYAIQETGIKFCALEVIMRDLYNEVAQNAARELKEAEEQYKKEMEAFEAASKTPEEADSNSEE